MIPDGWKEESLDSLADYINGRAFKPADWKKSGLPIIRIAQITNPKAELDYYDGADVSHRNFITNGDLIFSWSATLATVFWNRGDGVLNQHLFKVVPKAGTDKTYLKQLIDYSIPALAGHSHGSTMKHIKRSALKDFIAPIPPLPEQKRIAEVLGGVDLSIEATYAVIAQTKKVKQGLLQELLTRGIGHTNFKPSPLGEIPEAWEVVNLEELGNNVRPVVKAGPFGSSLKKEFYVESGYRVYGQEQVIGGNLSIGNYYINQNKFDELKSCEVSAGDILISLVGTLGKVLIVPEKFESGVINPRLIRISPDHSRITSEFLACWLTSEYVVSYLKSSSNGGTMGVINGKILKSLFVPVPSIPEQNKIVQTNIAIDTQITAESEKLTTLQNLKKGLMHDLLTGKVRVNKIKEQGA